MKVINESILANELKRTLDEYYRQELGQRIKERIELARKRANKQDFNSKRNVLQ